MTVFSFLVRHVLHTAVGDNLVRFLSVEFKTEKYNPNLPENNILLLLFYNQLQFTVGSSHPL